MEGIIYSNISKRFPGLLGVDKYPESHYILQTPFRIKGGFGGKAPI
jgi:hypothetical protein